MIFVAYSCVLTSSRVHGTSNVCSTGFLLLYGTGNSSPLLENNEARKQAIRRHLEFFNTQPFVAAPILGVTLALEEQRANGAEIDDGAINGIKVGLMGPLAGVGDPIFWGTVRPVFADTWVPVSR